MPATKRKSATTDRPAKRDGAMRVVDAAVQVVALNDDDEALDDILGEIVEPRPTDAPVNAVAAEPSLDDILGEIAPAVDTAPTDDPFDDLIGELSAPEPAAATDPLDDILNEVTTPEAPAPVDELDDILGEITGSAPAPAPVDDLDDILGEVAGPAPAAPAVTDDLDDILGEITGPAPAPAPVDDLDEILGEIVGPAPVVATPADDFDDILSEIAGPEPVAAAPVDDFDDILSEISGPAPAAADADLALDDVLSEISSSPPVEVPVEPEAAPAPADAAVADEEPDAALAPKKPGLGAKIGGLVGGIAGKLPKLPKLSFIPSLTGTRQISRKAHAGLVGLCCVLGVVTIGQAVFIAVRPAAQAHAPTVHVPKGATLVPTDYSKVDLELYHDKVRSLPEGGRDMLRNPQIKEAIVGLDNGEQLYESLVALARRSPMADRVDVRDNRITIASCDGVTCYDKDFKLSYDIEHEAATVCVMERYVDGTSMSYSYSESGYKEQPHC